MKKTLTVLCVILILCAVVFVGCGKKKDDTLGSTSSADPSTDNRVEDAVSDSADIVGDAATGIGDIAGDVVTGAGDTAKDIITGAENAVSDVIR